MVLNKTINSFAVSPQLMLRKQHDQDILLPDGLEIVTPKSLELSEYVYPISSTECHTSSAKSGGQMFLFTSHKRE